MNINCSFSKRFGMIACFMFLPCWQLYAQETTDIPFQRISETLSIDGNLDEIQWEQAESISGFLQFEPAEGEPPTHNTEVWVLHGDGNLYVGAVLYDDQPSAIEATLARRDEFNRADWFLISIDANLNRRTAYTFGVNAAGVQFDGVLRGISSTGSNNNNIIAGMDPSWDAVWESSVRITERGWELELRIPYSMLRFPKTEMQSWGIRFLRNIPRLGETTEWPLVSHLNRRNLIEQFRTLDGINNISSGRHIEVRPYTVFQMDTREQVQAPGTPEVQTTFNAGGDVKVGLGPNSTLDLTVNPDFGQVELDPAVLNLTAFETIFEEKRPFFVEGMPIYQFDAGPGNLMYTRRIGAAQSIIGAGKFSGRTSRALSYGVLGAVEGDNFNPSRYYGVGRVRRQFSNLSEIGGIITTFNESPAGQESSKTSITSGLDWNIRFQEGEYGIDGFTAMTHRENVLPGENSSTGYAGNLGLRKRKGSLTGSIGIDLYHDQFNANDLGHTPRNNYTSLSAQTTYQLNEGNPFGAFRRAEVSGAVRQRYSYDEGSSLGFDPEFLTIWLDNDFRRYRYFLRMERIFGGYDIYETRGLGPWARPALVYMEWDYETDSRSRIFINPKLINEFHADGGSVYAIRIESRWDIGSRLYLTGDIHTEWEREVTAWLANESFKKAGSEWAIGQTSASPDQLSEDDYFSFAQSEQLDKLFTDMTPFSDQHYFAPVFGTRNTRSIDFTLRSNITVNPYISLQIYSQFFVAKGRYRNFQIMKNRDTLTPINSYPKQSEFTINNFQSNMVFRWQYRPGSYVSVVWTHGRHLREQINPLAPHGPSVYDQSFSDQLGKVWGIFPENMLLLKVEYTFLN